MSNFWKQKLARESVEAASEDNISNIETPEQNLETQLTDLASEDAGLDQLMTDAATLEGDMVKTEDAVDAADEALDDGEELSEYEAESKEIGQESIRKRWGITRGRVARESFRNGRGATKIAREGWKDTLKDLWRRLVELIENLINRAKDQILKATNVGKSAVSRGTKYLEEIGKLDKSDKDNISGGWMSKLAIDNTVDVNGCIDVAGKLCTSNASDAMVAMVAGATKYVHSKGEDSSAFKADDKEITLPAKTAKKMKTLPGMEEGTPHAIFGLPGNGYFQSATKEVGGVSITTAAYFNAGDKVEEKEIKTPSTGELKTAAQALKKIGGDYEKVLKDFRKYDQKLAELKTAIKKTIADFDKSEEENKTGLRAARQQANAALTSSQAINKAIHGSVRATISGLSGYIGSGIGAYSKKKAA